jgi:hypothetical protein
MIVSNKLAIVFSGDLSTNGGIQSWAKTIKSNSLVIEHISLKCSRRNFHYPAFKRNNFLESYKIVICCDPLSLLWASRNVLTYRLVIGVFHKDEWVLDEKNIFENSIIHLLKGCAIAIKASHVNIKNLPRSLPSIELPLMPRNSFVSAPKINSKGKDIIVLGRLEAFKGFPVYLSRFAACVHDKDPTIKIHVVGKGSLFDQLQATKLENTIFHGYLDEYEIYQLAKCCLLGLSSGLSAIELSSVGIPVAVAKEDATDMILTCFTGKGYFIFQDDFNQSENLDLLEVFNNVYKTTQAEWNEYSIKSQSIISNDYFIDKLVEFKEIEKPRKKWSIHLYLFYMIYVILDKIHIKKFSFIHRIP